MKLKTKKISRRTVEALKVDRDTVFWDSELSGFGVRAYPSGSRYYVVQARAPGESARRLTVGRHGVITADEARRRAAHMISRIKAGEDPAPEAERHADSPTVGELARTWMEQDVETHCKPKTQVMYRSVLKLHLLPKLGRKPALAVDRDQVMNLHYSLRAKPVTANYAVRVLSRIWTAAEDRGDLPEGRNPCRHVVHFRKRRRERFLSEAEYERFGEALSDAEAGKMVSGYAIAAIRLLLLTGCRKNEILSLKWRHVDLEAGELNLPDTKTGARTVVLSPEAVAVLSGIPKVDGNPYVIPGRNGTRRSESTLNRPWKVILDLADLEDFRIHDLRHSFASRALALGESLPAIGRLLGHARVETTARYAHLAGDAVHEAAVRVSDSIAEDILGIN